MNAVIVSGGKQYQVAQGQTLKLEKLAGEVGNTVRFDQILLITEGDDIRVGAPFIEGALVSGEVIEQGRRPKINIIKFRRRKHHMKRMGHRQDYTAVKITEIKLGGKKAAEKSKASAKTSEE